MTRLQTYIFFFLASLYTIWAAIVGNTPDFPAVLLKAGATASLLLFAGLTFFKSFTRKGYDKGLGIILVGLPFCLAGDVFLGIPGEALFIPGLAAFLVGYAVFSVSLVMRLSLVKYGLALIPALIPSALLLSWFTLSPEMIWPVRIFIAVQTSFLAAGLTMAITHKRASLTIGLGALLLYLSDVALGIGKFTPALPPGALIQVLVHIPYFGGLYLLVHGTMRRVKSPLGA